MPAYKLKKLVKIVSTASSVRLFSVAITEITARGVTGRHHVFRYHPRYLAVAPDAELKEFHRKGGRANGLANLSSIEE